MKNYSGRSVVCFDIGNVLVELGPPIESWLEPSDASKFKALLHDYSIGNVGSSSFFQNLNAISRHQINEIPVENWFTEKRLVGPFAGAAKLLSKLADQKVEIYLFSNTNETHWNHVKTYLLAHDRAFLSFLMKKKKPDAEAFKHVERSIRAYGKDIIFFDDSPANIEVANRIGWNGYLAVGKNPIEGVKKILKELHRMDV
ncbi:hypothetical protein E4A48_08705 [Xanthomonas cerealis pv. cerealis]|uniref:HAD family phosphatase n=1 Tax=Xanthomonas cerealis pv. cerealis TaxID=152263 RepID=A0A514ECN1_9XANT|nr:HAD-IA family hydrolase [Xanthomonas translucens]QDI03770.1 hypothetical protein E4A48_08705 [Xanthomonas translucens pv. cerealis]